MSDRLEKDQEIDSNWLTQWEKQRLQEMEDGDDNLSAVEERAEREKELAAQKIFATFQGAASNIALLYKAGSSSNQNLWVPFQNAATSVTTLYKDGIDVMKRCFEMGKQIGHHKRNDELIAWTKTGQRHIIREELLGLLCGKRPPPPPRTPRHHRAPSSHGGRVNRLTVERSPRHSSSRSASSECVDIQPFCDALALHGLNGAMSNIGIRNTGGSGTSAPGSAAAAAATATGAPSLDDMHTDVLEEIQMRRFLDSRKRPPSSSPVDSVLDSPTRKRSRLL